MLLRHVILSLLLLSAACAGLPGCRRGAPLTLPRPRLLPLPPNIRSNLNNRGLATDGGVTWL